MSRIRIKADEYRQEDFRKALRHAQADNDTSRKDLAEQVGTKYSTFCKRLNNPDELSLGEVHKMVRVIPIDPEALLKFVGYDNKQIKSFAENTKEVTTNG